MITPSDIGDDTDCDSSDEESNDPNHLNHNQLQAEAEVYYKNADMPSEWDEENDFPLSVFVKKNETNKDYVQCSWLKSDIDTVSFKICFRKLLWKKVLYILTISSHLQNL